MKILFTICGRAGSKGFINKNLLVMNGIPLVYYSLAAIELFKKSNPKDNVKVAVNTDSQKLVDEVKKQRIISDILYVDRKEELAGDKVAKFDVIRDTYKESGEDFDAVVDLDITSPLRRVEDIENALEKYKSDNNCELVVSVVPARRSPYFNMIEKKGDYYRKICGANFTTRQEAPSSYELNTSIYVYRPSFLESNITDTILDHRCQISLMKDYLVLDIDSQNDFQIMQALHRFYIESDYGLKMIFDEAMRFLKYAD